MKTEISLVRRGEDGGSERRPAFLLETVKAGGGQSPVATRHTGVPVGVG